MRAGKKEGTYCTSAGGGRGVATGAVAAAARSAPHSANEINALPPLGLIRSDLGCRGRDAANYIT